MVMLFQLLQIRIWKNFLWIYHFKYYFARNQSEQSKYAKFKASFNYSMCSIQSNVEDLDSNISSKFK